VSEAETTSEGASPALPLLATLDLSAAEALRRDLATQLSAGGILLDGSAVERVATPCLQVLAAAAAMARDSNQTFRLYQASDALRAATFDLGLNAAIPFED